MGLDGYSGDREEWKGFRYFWKVKSIILPGGLNIGSKAEGRKKVNVLIWGLGN